MPNSQRAHDTWRRVALSLSRVTVSGKYRANPFLLHFCTVGNNQILVL